MKPEAFLDTDLSPRARTAMSYLMAFWRGDAQAAATFCTPDAKFIFARSLPYERRSPILQALTAIHEDMFTSFDPDGFEIDMHRLLCEGDTVMAEYLARGKTRDGRDYENDYLMSISFRDGLIEEVRPYTDTLHLYQLLGGEHTAD